MRIGSYSPLVRGAAAVLAVLVALLVFVLARRQAAEAPSVRSAPALASAPAPATPSPRDIEVFDVGARARTMAAGFKRGKPHKEVYYQSSTGTAHLHLITPGQTIPLHIHEHSEEATVPVMGQADVTQRFASGTHLETRKARYDEGTLIVSPQDCAHEWKNPLGDHYHASLVFTLGQTFTGNLFVDPDDARITTSSPAIVVDPRTQLDDFVASSDTVRKIDVPVAQGSLATVYAKGSFPIEPRPDELALVYVVRGNARIEGVSTPVSLAPSVLAILRHAPGARVVASQGAVVFFLVGIPRHGSARDAGGSEEPAGLTP